MSRRVAIVGAGITGLVCAWALERRGVDVTSFEAAGHAGGPIRTVRRDGFLAERGPHTLMESNDSVGELVSGLGLERERVYATDAARKRFMVRDGEVRALPTSPPAFLTSDAFSARAKLALAREPFVPRRDDGVDESVTNFVTRRLNREFLDYGLELLVNGVWAGDPNRLSARYAFRKMVALERDYGSLVRGGIRRARQGRNPEKTRMLSFARGNQTLTDALAAHASDLRLERPVRSLRRTESGTWRVRNGEYDDVVLTISGPAFASIDIEAEERLDTSFFGEIAYPSVAVITFGFRRTEVEHPLDGFGVIAPIREKLDVLGALFTSTLFEGRAPDGHVTVAAFVGGMRRPDLAELSDDERVERAFASLREMLGIAEEPVFVEQSFWQHALPQYEVGYGRLLARMEGLERRNPGLWIAGNVRQGVAVGDLIEAGTELAARIEDRR